MRERFLTEPLGALLQACPDIDSFFLSLGLAMPDGRVTILEYASGLEDETLEDKGMDRLQLVERFEAFMMAFEGALDTEAAVVESIEIIGGHDKSGKAENVSLRLLPGDTVSIVGPTGSGKSRLLADIEWMAQKDTPTGRTLLVNGNPTSPGLRYSAGRRLVAQLSQHMNFIMDLTVAEFVEMHGRARMASDIPFLIDRVVRIANTITGEPFSADTRVTSLSGGQSRALMIADTALVSSSPVVLIDEIENAGIDRGQALNILVSRRKIVLVATHDPVLALAADRRVVLENGGISKVLKTSSRERESLATLRRLDALLLEVRNAVRKGETVEGKLAELLNVPLGIGWYTTPEKAGNDRK